MRELNSIFSMKVTIENNKCKKYIHQYMLKSLERTPHMIFQIDETYLFTFDEH